jgi:hypothetical protein
MGGIVPRGTLTTGLDHRWRAEYTEWNDVLGTNHYPENR